jgi:hypothetical protein
MTCPHAKDCALFPRFKQQAFLKVWQTHYCEADFARCARFVLAKTGAVVADTLLPNGKHLALAPKREAE